MEIKTNKIPHIGMLKKAVKEMAPEAHLYEVADSSGEGEYAIFGFCLLRGKKATQFKIKSNQLNDYSHLKDAVRRAYGRISVKHK